MEENMSRSFTALCFGLTLPCLMHAASSTIYAPVPYWTIAPTSTATFESPGLIPTPPGADGFFLSPNGKTMYYVLNGAIVAMDLATGKTLGAYHTKRPILGPIILLPNASQLWIGTCSRYVQGLGCLGGGYVEVIDAVSGRPLAALSMGQDNVVGLVAAPNSAAVYASLIYESEGSGSRRQNLPYGEAQPATTVPLFGVVAIDVASLTVGASFTPPEGGEPGSMAVSADGRTGYVLASWLGTFLYTLDLPQMTMTGTIDPPAGYGWGGAMVMSGNGSTLAVWGGPGIVLVDPATNSVAQTIPLSVVGADDLSITPDGNTLYFRSFSYSSIFSWVLNLVTVDIPTGTVTTAIPGEDIWQALLSPNGKEIYLILGNGAGVFALQEGSITGQKLGDVGEPPTWLAVSPDGGTLYSAGQNGVWAGSTVTGQPTLKMLPGVSVAAFAVSSKRERLYALSTELLANTGQVTSVDFMVVNTSTGAIETTIPLPTACYTLINSPGSIAISLDGSEAYVLLDFCSTQAVAIDLNTKTVSGQIHGTSGSGLAVNPKDGYLYVSAGGSVEVLYMATNQVVGTIPLTANAIAFSPDGTVAYIAGSQSGVGGVGVVDTSTFAVTDFIPGANGGGGQYGEGAGQSIAVTPDGNFIYVGGSGIPCGPGGIIDTQSLQVVAQFQSCGPIAIH
jgi:DNA-binding beta-propeller fold protein YncE